MTTRGFEPSPPTARSRPSPATASPAFAGDGGPALDAELDFGPFVSCMAVGPDGRLYYGDASSNRVRQVLLPQPGFTGTAFSVPAADGSEVYGFDLFGRHLTTKVLPTNGARVTLGYNGIGPDHDAHGHRQQRHDDPA